MKELFVDNLTPTYQRTYRQEEEIRYSLPSSSRTLASTETISSSANDLQATIDSALLTKGLRHSSTLTELSAFHETTAEVELVTLLEEQIPRYHLRADTLTAFSGYENQDWFVKYPVIDPNESVDLSPETVEETLKFFVLSADRLSQMTKTYNDIDAVTRLLEEKERDLELAARIGQSLLEQNKSLKSRTEELEADLSSANDTIEKYSFEIYNASERVTQLKHDLSTKNGLLQIYSADLEKDETEPSSPINTSLRDKTSLLVNWDNLHEKVFSLEEENIKLRIDASARAADIEIEERKELQLIHDCAKQLTDANIQLITLQEELARRADDNIQQQEEITNLLTQVVDLQRKTRNLSFENESLRDALHISHECQNELSSEMLDIKEKYSTLLAAFHELQEDIKSRSKHSFSQWPPTGFMPVSESLAAEIESTLESDGYESEFSSLNRLQKRDPNDTRCHSPESVLSAGSGPRGYPRPALGHLPYASGGGSCKSAFLMSDKLRIVKSLEGSETLSKWRKLATPHLGVILEQHSGVQGKALKDLDCELLHYVINMRKHRKLEQESQSTPIEINTTPVSVSVSNSNQDLENAIIDYSLNPGKLFDATSSTFTYTTTSLSQSTENTMVTPSFSCVQLSTGHNFPITSVSTCVTFSGTSSLRNIVQGIEIQSLLQHDKEEMQDLNIPTTPASSPTKSEDSQKSQALNFGAFSTLLSQSLRNKCSNYVKYLSGSLSGEGWESSQEEVKERVKRDECQVPHMVSVSSASPIIASASTSDFMATNSVITASKPDATASISESRVALEGLKGLASPHLACFSPRGGVITKGSMALPGTRCSVSVSGNNVPRPRSLSLQRKQEGRDIEPQKREQQQFVGTVSSLKTLRKGGFV